MSFNDLTTVHIRLFFSFPSHPHCLIPLFSSPTYACQSNGSPKPTPPSYAQCCMLSQFTTSTVGGGCMYAGPTHFPWTGDSPLPLGNAKGCVLVDLRSRRTPDASLHYSWQPCPHDQILQMEPTGAPTGNC